MLFKVTYLLSDKERVSEMTQRELEEARMHVEIVEAVQIG